VLDILGRKMTPQTPADGISGPDGPRSPVEGARQKRIWPYVLRVALVLAALYTVVGFFSGRVRTPGSTVAGIARGGKSAPHSEHTLRSELGDQAEKEIVLQAGEPTAKLDPAEAGITFDAEATVDRVTGFSLDPTVIWDRLFGDDEVAPVIDV